MPRDPATLPAHVGSVELTPFGARLVAIRCPEDLAPLLRQAGGTWEPGSRRWLVERRRLGPLIRDLQSATDPLFRRVGLDLDGRP